MVVGEVIQSLGLGQQATLAVIMVIGVLYLLRAKKYSKVVVGAVGTVWLATVSVLIAAAVAIYMGWVDPSPTAFISDVWAVVKAIIGIFTDLVGEYIP